MNTKFFEEQRQEMVAAMRAIAEHMADELGKTALDERVLRAMATVPRHEFVPIEGIEISLRRTGDELRECRRVHSKRSFRLCSGQVPEC